MSAPAGAPDGMPDRAPEAAGLRALCGDVHLRPWRLTPARVRLYAAGLHALFRAGEAGDPAVLGEDPAAVLDPDRAPALRPWEGAPADGRDPVDVVVAGLAARPATWARIAAVLPVEEFVATHVKMGACVVAAAALAGSDPAAWDVGAVRRWAERSAAHTPAEREFADNVVSTVEHAPLVEAAFTAGFAA